MQDCVSNRKARDPLDRIRPLYIDVSAGDGSDKESYVLSQKGNNLYQHEIINENLAITEFYSSVDEYENDEYDIAFGFKFDISGLRKGLPRGNSLQSSTG